jgi:CheY-like chemotaxis protein
MNFDAHKDEVLRKAREIHGQKASSRHDVQESWKTLKRQSESGPVESKPLQRKALVFFGAVSVFSRSLLESLEAAFEVKAFDDADEAVDYIVQWSPVGVVADMDPPSSWQKTTDVFTTSRTIGSNVPFILCTARPTDRDVRTLEAQRACVMAKPVSVDEVLQALG